MLENGVSEPLSQAAKALLSLRRKLLVGAFLFLGLTVFYYVLSPRILFHLTAHLNQKLAFFGVLESFLALLKVAISCAILTLIPYFLWLLWLLACEVFGFPSGRGFGLSWQACSSFTEEPLFAIS